MTDAVERPGQPGPRQAGPGPASPEPASPEQSRPGLTWAERRAQATGWRARARRTHSGAMALKAATLLLGVAFVALGVFALVLPGPLTIPPILLGLYILSTEFAWADKLLQRAKKSAKEAWEQAKAKPVSSAAVTIGGLVLAGVAIWAVVHFDLVDRGKDLVGL